MLAPYAPFSTTQMLPESCAQSALGLATRIPPMFVVSCHQVHMRNGAMSAFSGLRGIAESDYNRRQARFTNSLRRSSRQMKKIFTAPGVISKIVTMADRTIRIQVDCQEMNPGEEVVMVQA